MYINNRSIQRKKSPRYIFIVEIIEAKRSAILSGPNHMKKIKLAAAKLIRNLGLFPGFRFGDCPLAPFIRASFSLDGVFVALAIDLGEKDPANPGL